MGKGLGGSVGGGRGGGTKQQEAHHPKNFLKRSKELSLKEFDSGKLTWDSKFKTKDWVRPINIFMVKASFTVPSTSMMSPRPNQSFWQRTSTANCLLGFRTDMPCVYSPLEKPSYLACPKLGSLSFFQTRPFFSLQKEALPKTDTWALSASSFSVLSQVHPPTLAIFISQITLSWIYLLFFILIALKGNLTLFSLNSLLDQVFLCNPSSIMNTSKFPK